MWFNGFSFSNSCVSPDVSHLLSPALFCFMQESEPMNSWAIEPLEPQGNWQLLLLSHYRILEVSMTDMAQLLSSHLFHFTFLYRMTLYVKNDKGQNGVPKHFFSIALNGLCMLVIPFSLHSYVKLPVHCEVRSASGHPDLPQPGRENSVSLSSSWLFPFIL